MADMGIKHCVELSWWEEVELQGGTGAVRVASTPAQHWSTRAVFDRNTRCWYMLNGFCLLRLFCCTISGTVRMINPHLGVKRVSCSWRCYAGLVARVGYRNPPILELWEVVGAAATAGTALCFFSERRLMSIASNGSHLLFRSVCLWFWFSFGVKTLILQYNSKARSISKGPKAGGRDTFH